MQKHLDLKQMLPYCGRESNSAPSALEAHALIVFIFYLIQIKGAGYEYLTIFSTLHLTTYYSTREMHIN